MSTIRRFLLPLLLALGMALGVMPAGPPVAAAATAKPWTVPALKQWTGAAGSFTADASTRVVSSDPALAATARTLAADLSQLTGRRARVAHGTARRHDIVLRTDPAVRPKAEGYALAIGDSAVITGATGAGVFWGTRSLLQMLTQDLTIPAGTAKDWPDYRYRGITVCNCSKFFSVPWFERLIKTSRCPSSPAPSGTAAATST
jgi:hexosaminidase